ncbi:MAG: Ltp family lipoprotein [Paracoccus sp.]|nr:Ltp family lipoprotein [Paracoccus sp. (in: a-proteobacteria)]
MKRTFAFSALSFLFLGLATADAQPLSGPQGNAVRSANNYLSFKGFSAAGLIQQLSSPYGDGYSVEDATAAVNSLSVDWSEQAARSAEQYLGMMGFSCSGLIEQLSSSAGESFTRAEAEYGARKAGAC